VLCSRTVSAALHFELGRQAVEGSEGVHVGSRIRDSPENRKFWYRGFDAHAVE
jgi:hypothetical protein